MEPIQPYSTEKLKLSPELNEVQKYFPINQDDYNRLKKDIEKNGIRDPLKVYFKNNECLILGGANRWQIAKEMNILQIPIKIYTLSPDKRKALAIQDNLARRHLTQKQKQNIIELLLKENPQASSRSIAKKIKVSPTTVSKIKQKTGVQSGHVTGEDGKTYKFNFEKTNTKESKDHLLILINNLKNKITNRQEACAVIYILNNVIKEIKLQYKIDNIEWTD